MEHSLIFIAAAPGANDLLLLPLKDTLEKLLGKPEADRRCEAARRDAAANAHALVMARQRSGGLAQLERVIAGPGLKAHSESVERAAERAAQEAREALPLRSPELVEVSPRPWCADIIVADEPDAATRAAQGNPESAVLLCCREPTAPLNLPANVVPCWHRQTNGAYAAAVARALEIRRATRDAA